MRKLYLIFSICILVSCSDDTEPISKIDTIYGSWEKIENISPEPDNLDSNYDYAAKQKLNFNRDNSFEWLTSIVKNDSNETLGYIMKETGSFSQNENKLIFNFNRFQAEQDSETNTYRPTPLENLILTGQNIEMEYNFKIFNTNKTLLFDFPSCAPNSTCPADIQFNRVI